jgi:hypothetical protein
VLECNKYPRKIAAECNKNNKKPLNYLVFLCFVGKIIIAPSRGIKTLRNTFLILMIQYDQKHG